MMQYVTVFTVEHIIIASPSQAEEYRTPSMVMHVSMDAGFQPVIGR